MKTVKVKGIGVQVKGISYFKDNIFQVTEEEYEPIKEFVDVLQEDKIQDAKERVVIIKVENEDFDLKEVEEYLYNCLENFDNVPTRKKTNLEENEDENNNVSDTNVGDSNEDEELEALKDRAKELGINVTHNMKKETIIKKIEEIEQDPGENPNPEGE